MEIIYLLAQSPFSVQRIAEQTNLTIANASQHLQILKGARLVEISKKGNFIFYHLASEEVFHGWRALPDFGLTQNAEAVKLVRDFNRSNHGIEAITLDELHKNISSREIIILDVRPKDEYKTRTHCEQYLFLLRSSANALKNFQERQRLLLFVAAIMCLCR